MLKNFRSRWVPATLIVAVSLSGCSQDPVKQKMRALRRGPVEQCAAAAKELGALKEPRAVGPLSAALQDQDESVANAAALALGQIGDPRAIAPLAAALRRAATRWNAAEALVALGAPALESILAALSDGDAQVSKALITHLKQHEVKDRRLVEPLLKQLHSSDWLVRQAAAESLGRHRRPQGPGGTDRRPAGRQSPGPGGRGAGVGGDGRRRGGGCSARGPARPHHRPSRPGPGPAR